MTKVALTYTNPISSYPALRPLRSNRIHDINDFPEDYVVDKGEHENRQSDKYKGGFDNGNSDDDNDNDDDDDIDFAAANGYHKNEDGSSKNVVAHQGDKSRGCGSAYSYPTPHFVLGSITNDESDADDYDCEEGDRSGGKSSRVSGHQSGHNHGRDVRDMDGDVLAMQGFSFTGSNNNNDKDKGKDKGKDKVEFYQSP